VLIGKDTSLEMKAKELEPFSQRNLSYRSGPKEKPNYNNKPWLSRTDNDKKPKPVNQEQGIKKKEACML
jgi:hypothetical protein